MPNSSFSGFISVNEVCLNAVELPMELAHSLCCSQHGGSGVRAEAEEATHGAEHPLPGRGGPAEAGTGQDARRAAGCPHR